MHNAEHMYTRLIRITWFAICNCIKKLSFVIARILVKDANLNDIYPQHFLGTSGRRIITLMKDNIKHMSPSNE